MFALEDGSSVSHCPFFALFPDGSISPNSAHPRVAVSSFVVTPTPALCLPADRPYRDRFGERAALDGRGQIERSRS